MGGQKVLMVRYEKVQFVSNEYFPEEFSSDGKNRNKWKSLH